MMDAPAVDFDMLMQLAVLLVFAVLVSDHVAASQAVLANTQGLTAVTEHWLNDAVLVFAGNGQAAVKASMLLAVMGVLQAC